MAMSRIDSALEGIVDAFSEYTKLGEEARAKFRERLLYIYGHAPWVEDLLSVMEAKRKDDDDRYGRDRER